MTSLAHAAPSRPALAPAETRPRADAGEITALALLNCAVRELCAPGRQVWPALPYLVVRLPRAGVMLRARLLRSPLMTPRLATPVEELRDGWSPLGWQRLAELVAGELELTTGRANPEFADQVAASHDAIATMIGEGRRPAGDPFLDSEQALLAGHRFHPSPKARQGADWPRYAPETGSRFPLHWLAVREDAIAEEGDVSLLDRLGPPVRAGYRVLPAHPWQLALLRPESEAIIDLGPYGPEAVPTASVRTVYVPDAFLKFSLDVRITNCVRKNAWYELPGAVALTRILRPVFEGLSAGLLGEPGYRTVTLTDPRLHEGLGVIVRDGVGGFAGTPLLAAAVADPYARSGAAVARLLGGASPEHLLAWWDAYVRHVAPPVLRAYLEHGVVLEPHLQNVLICLDDDGMPIQAIFRDLEGTKLLHRPWASFLAGLPGPVAGAMTYDAERGWDRVVYCLFVNHLAEVAAAIADLCPPLERELWRLARHHVARCAGETPAVPGGAARLRALLAGVPLPAKANLRTRWARDPDREAAYVSVPNPLADLGAVPGSRPGVA
ncbi:IucA/IucC family protein [Actinoallomurus bryophytorum]|uniref:Siderophore synthetase component n=1 Tax=Actinoallomurus bryophytorum TaxID=1490222 RepID=A0A543CEU8_9ACTN|nr:IucA/IucC family protein [Actinoallomurus bryophytorum]TQL95625.1 siderophore synthetase component [Actinoallomurus bryophytorum]